MLTTREGWAVGFFFPKGEGAGDSTVLHTVDGAKHWDHLPIWEHGGLEPRNLFSFGDRLNGSIWWMDVGEAQPHRSRTSDGGRTWQDRKTDDTGTLIKFFDPRRGIALGGPFDAPSLLVTEDAGETWAQRRLPNGMDFVECSSFVDPSVGYMAGSGTDQQLQLMIMSTADGGTTWTKASIPPTNGWVVDCTRSGGTTGWVVVWPSNDTGSVILRSTDGGRTWANDLNPMLNGPRYHVSTIRFLTDALGFAFARHMEDKGSDLLVTHDAGLHWSRERRLSSYVTECAVFERTLWCIAGLDILKVRPDAD
jgi:photosystem II stability/assembly factor-like uncharacterized protein